MPLATAIDWVMRGDLGIPSHHLSDPLRRDAFMRALTREKRVWGGAPMPVSAARHADCHVWVPRHYDPTLWDNVGRWEWHEGEPYNFPMLAKLDPDRDQIRAVPTMIDFVREHKGGILVAGTGTGKCLGVGTPVLMANGRVKPVEAVAPGDRLMGPSGEARTVLSTNSGKGLLYRVDPIKGEPWVCNDVHVLTLVRTDTDEVVDISLDKWHASTAKFKHRHKQFSVGVERFEHEPAAPAVDPYFLGVWFGDGAKTLRSLATEPAALSCVQVSKPDPEIRALCEETARVWGLKCRVFDLDRCPTYALSCDDDDDDDERDECGHFTKSNPLLVAMRLLLSPKLEVPEAVLRGSRATRLAFLAGFLDADAEMSANCFFLSQKREDWARAAWWLARSLGLCATITTRKSRDQHGTDGLYHVVSISGATDQIPTRIERKKAGPRRQKKVATRTGFTVTAIGEGDYYGFTLDGDGRFLLGDFTVTHNTLMGCAIAGALGRKIGIPVYVGHMTDNWVEHLKLVFGFTDADIGIVQGDRCDLGRPVTLFSMQTLMSRGVPDALQRQIGTLVCDEVHKHGAVRWREIVSLFAAKYRLGLTATPARKDGLDDIVFWSFGNVGFRAKRIRNEEVKPAKVRMLAVRRTYPESRYFKFERDIVTGQWKKIRPDSLKYDKVLADDLLRNQMLADDIVKAVAKGRQLLVLSSLVDHLVTLRRMTIRLLDPVHPLDRIVNGAAYAEDHRFYQTGTLEAGLSVEERAVVSEADVIFATYQMGRDALNIPKLDTGVFATPPTDIEQPFGRLREKVEGIERRDIMWVDPFEKGTPYSEKRAGKRLEFYKSQGCEVKELPR